MKTTKRLDYAIGKLYTAFHNNTLNPECCKQCAVGNICDNTDSWKNFSDSHGSLQLNYIGLVHEKLGRKFNGYSPSELLKIEHEFLKACGYKLPLNYRNSKPENATSKDNLIKGLSAVIEYLCRLDKVQNVMDISSLFQTNQSTPAKQLNLSKIA